MFITPRPEQVEEYFGAVTNASGMYSPPRRPSDAPAVTDAG